MTRPTHFTLVKQYNLKLQHAAAKCLRNGHPLTTVSGHLLHENKTTVRSDTILPPNLRNDTGHGQIAQAS